MTNPRAGAILLFALTICCLPVYAQQPGSVVLSVCNVGKVDIDVFVSKESGLDGGHIASGACSRVYAETGSPAAAHLGFAFVDSSGKWGAAKKLDLLPDFGLRVLTLADQNVVVPHGNSKVSLPMQLLFRPRDPTCISTMIDTYPLNFNSP